MRALIEKLEEGKSEMVDVVVRAVDSSIDLAETAQGLLGSVSDILVGHKASKDLKTSMAAFRVAIKEMEKVKKKIQ